MFVLSVDCRVAEKYKHTSADTDLGLHPDGTFKLKLCLIGVEEPQLSTLSVDIHCAA